MHDTVSIGLNIDKGTVSSWILQEKCVLCMTLCTEVRGISATRAACFALAYMCVQATFDCTRRRAKPKQMPTAKSLYEEASVSLAHWREQAASPARSCQLVCLFDPKIFLGAWVSERNTYDSTCQAGGQVSQCWHAKSRPICHYSVTCLQHG